MGTFDIRDVVTRLREAASQWETTTLDAEQEAGAGAFRILVATILSQRTLDRHTEEGTRRLFARAKSPRGMLRLSEEEIAELIRPVGFYKTKARTIRKLCEELIARFGGEVPDDMESLLSLPGVGRKTANLVLTHGFSLPGICVDTHVHRILNRLGFLRTKDAEATEMTLRRKLPEDLWIEINGLLVGFGQHVCRPLSPHCSTCPVRPVCRRRGVERSR